MPVSLGRALLATLLAFAAPARAADAPAKTAAPAAAQPATGGGDAAGEPLDYGLLSHVVSIESLRAGSHDPSGHNSYVFKATLYALLNSSEERNLDFSKRKQIAVDLGQFGATTIDSLAFWHADEKVHDVKELKIEGNEIRELAARTMTELKVQEGEVAMMVEVVMLKKNKKFFFFGEDAAIAKASYYPIPQTKFDTPLRTNQTLVISDDKGTNVKLVVRYEKPAVSAKTK